jgi:Tol biopolymer transport system component
MYTPEVNDGTIVALYSGGSSSPVVAPFTAHFGDNRVFSPDLKNSSSSDFNIVGGKLLQEQNIFLMDLPGETQEQITTDGAAPGASRRHQYDDPYFSPDSRYVTYGGFLPTPVQGIGIDTFDVFVQDLVTRAIQVPTQTHGQRRRNAFPTFSSDGNWLVFVSDRAGVTNWEMYGLPITGGVVATDSAETVRLTNTGGSITVGTPGGGLPKPPVLWSPPGTQPSFAVLSIDARLYIVTMSASGGTQTTVTGVDGTPRQFAWSTDGQMLAITDFDKIYTAGLAGTATEVHAAVEGDQIRDLRWSPDGKWIAYRVVRGGIGWFELVDVGAGKITEPAVLTTSTSSNNVTSYARKMDMAPVFSQNNELYLLEFIAGEELTPRVTELDVTGIVQ